MSSLYPFQSYGIPSMYGNYPIQNSMNTFGYNNRDFGQVQQNYQQNTNITFVNGVEGAKAFQMNPNCSMLLMDSDNKKFYVKTTDNLGVAKITSYNFNEESIPTVNQEIEQKDTVELVSISRDEYDELNRKVNELDKFKSDVEKKLKDIL